jgi:hypothetical protein
MRPLSKISFLNHLIVIPAIGLCALLVTGASHAQTQSGSTAKASVWLTVSDRTLDKLRGGFDLGSGLVVSFGVTRMVYINDQLVTTTSFQLGDLSKLNGIQTSALGQQIGSQAQVVQNGLGNTVESGAAGVPMATYIQNTLSGQTIRNQTVIQANTNGLSMLRGLNLNTMISEAIANAIGNR